MDIEIDLFINGVPTEAAAQSICASIQRVLKDEHGTDIAVTFEDVSDEDEDEDGADDEQWQTTTPREVYRTEDE